MDDTERSAAERPPRRPGSRPTRRQFLVAAAGTTLLAGSGVIPGVPTTAQAQTTPLPGPPWRIGYIDSTPGPADAGFATARYYQDFRAGLRRLPAPYSPGNLHVVPSFSNKKLDKGALEERIRDLLDEKKVQVLVIGVTPAIPIAASLTRTVPIVMAVSADPIAAGTITQLPYSGKNITGMTMYSTELIPGQLQLLKSAAPDTVKLVVLSAGDPAMNHEWSKIEEEVAPSLGMQPTLVTQPDPAQFMTSILAKAPFDAIFVLSDVRMNHYARFLGQALTNQFAVPTLFGNSESVRGGGLVSLGADRPAMFEYAAQYVKQLLDGTDPASMAIQAPPRYEKGFNVATAVSLIGKGKNIKFPPWAVYPYAVVDA
jgi:putative ABC transport system substrate-binding protein